MKHHTYYLVLLGYTINPDGRSNRSVSCGDTILSRNVEQ